MIFLNVAFLGGRVTTEAFEMKKKKRTPPKPKNNPTGALVIKRMSRYKNVLLPRGLGWVLTPGLGLRTGTGFSRGKRLSWAWGRAQTGQLWDAPSGEELAISGLRWGALEECSGRQELIQSSAGFLTLRLKQSIAPRTGTRGLFERQIPSKGREGQQGQAFSFPRRERTPAVK